jgi:hypothetical protein
VSRLFGNQPKVSPQERVRDIARVQVRAGLLDPAAQQAEVETAVAAELPGEDPASTAATLLAEAQAVLAAEQTAWPRPTDHDRLQAAFAALTSTGSSCCRPSTTTGSRPGAAPARRRRHAAGGGRLVHRA